MCHVTHFPQRTAKDISTYIVGGSDDGVQHSELLGFWAILNNTTFPRLGLFPFSGERWFR
jgi:hypothetical protein